MKKLPNTQHSAQDPGYPLVTRERTDKLDLLQHLTANLARAIIVLGPEGVGKTRLLNLFKDTLSASAILCTITGDSLLNLEIIQGQIGETIAQKIPVFKSQSLSEALTKLPQRDVGVVLLIDEAGKLAPGVMEQIISYAGDNPMLRVVFALTHNELYLKNITDSAIDDCYEIEIPPLNELQCADFLEYLSTLPNPRIDFNAINETMVADLYRETHGIPGKILEKLPKPRNTRKLDYSAAILTCAVTALIAIALGVQWWSSRPKPATKTIAESKVDQQTASSEPATATKVQQPQQITVPPNTDTTKLDKIENNTNAAVSQNNAAAGLGAKAIELPPGKTDVAVQANNINTDQSQAPSASVQDVAKASTAVPTATQTTQALDEGGQWVLKQPAENITLQLMALSDKETLLEVMQRHQAMGSNLRYIKTTTKRGRERFVLLYGSFSNQEEASAEAKKLPNELRKHWLRKMVSLQAELNPAPMFLPTPPTTSANSP